MYRVKNNHYTTEEFGCEEIFFLSFFVDELWMKSFCGLYFEASVCKAITGAAGHEGSVW